MLQTCLNAVNGKRLYTRPGQHSFFVTGINWRQVNKTIHEGDTLQSYRHQVDVKKECLGNLADI